VDAEHRAIFLAAGQLERTVNSGAPEDRVRESLHNLLQLVESHFQHEERMMRESDFISYEWHCKQHDTVRSKAKALKKAGPEAMAGALEFMSWWLNEHTAVADRIMAAHLRNWTRRMAA
jgi:hemerythrin-like metal-binding protein